MNDDRISELYKGEIWSNALQERARRRIHWMCSQVVGERVLDLGCSQGVASILLGREGFTVVGVDIQESRVEYARADLADESEDTRQNVSFEVANGANLPFDDASFDSVLLGEVVEHLTVPDKVLEEVRRVLVPGGRLILTTPFGLSPHHDHKSTFYPAGVVGLMSNLFTVASVDVVDRYFRIVATTAADGSRPQQPDFEELFHHLDQVWESLDRDLAGLQADVSQSREELIAERKQSETGLAQAKDRHRTELLQRTDEIDALESALALRDGELDEVGAEIKRLQEELRASVALRSADQKRLSDAKQTASKQSAAMRRRSIARERDLLKRIDRLQRDRWKLRNRLALANWRLQSTKQRKWWRLGAAIGAVRRNPLRVFVLPFDVVSVMFSRSALPPRPKALPKPAKTVKPALPQTDQAPKPAAASAPSEEFSVPDIEPPIPVPARDVVVATLLDEFSFKLFEHEFRAVQVTPDNWKTVLDSEAPSLLLVESAWRGKDDLWLGQLAKEHGPSDVFTEMVTAFRNAGVPTVFWNKEDPPNYHLYIKAASLFDFVFTVCEECIPRYRDDLGHEQIYLLPFSAQPRIHNPISVGPRDRSVAFAGTYYAKKHPERVRQVEAVLDPALDFDLSIFSRVQSSGNYQWPERFEKHILGSLPYDDVLVAHKMFKLFVNVNSVVDSKSMCARRVFELAAAGTPVVSGVSPAIGQFFGDIVAQAEDADQARHAYRALLGSEELRARVALRGLRRVMRSHTAGHRVDEMLSTVGIEADRIAIPSVTLVAPTNRPQQIEAILKSAGTQTYPNLQLVVATHGFEPKPGEIDSLKERHGLEDVVIVPVPEDNTLGEVINAGFDAADGRYIGKIDDDNFYAPEFVGDLLDAFVYADAEIVGKWTHYTYVEGMDAMVLRFPGFENTYVDLVAGSAMVIDREVYDQVKFPARRVGEDTRFLRDAKAAGVRIYSADRFNYVYMRYSSSAHHTFNVSDLELAAKGTLVQFGLNLDHLTV